VPPIIVVANTVLDPTHTVDAPVSVPAVAVVIIVIDFVAEAIPQTPVTV
jgi:hypothetical protein